MRKKLVGLMLAFALFVPGVLLVACTPAKVVSFEVELATQKYQLVQNQIVVDYGEEIDISASDFVVTATLDNETTKVLSVKSPIKDGYTFSSNIPENTITPIGEYTITFTYGNLTPYEIDLVVEKADVDMSAVIWNYTQPFGYDGTEKTVVLTNLPNGVSVTYQNNTKTNIGEYQAVAIFSVNETNYNPIPNMTLAWKIEKGTIDVSAMTWDYTQPFKYDGKTKTVSMEGLPTGCEIAYTGTRSATEVGTYTTTATITPPSLDLYNEIEPIVLNWEIVKGDLAPVTAVNTIEKPYTAENITLTKEMISALPQNYVVKAITGTTEAKNVGTYSIVIAFEYTGADAASYNPIPNLEWTWKITPAALTLTAKDKTITYGQAAANDGFEVLGLLGQDTNLVLKGTAQYAYDYEVGDGVNTYDITLSGITADNYEIAFEKGTLTVEKAPLSITPYADAIVYGETTLTGLGFNAEGLVCEDTKEVVTGEAEYFYQPINFNAPGQYALTITSGLVADNYAITYKEGTFTITKRPLTITAVDAEVQVGGVAEGAGVTTQGFAGEETLSVLLGTLVYDFGGYDAQTSQIGDVFVLTPSGLTSENYQITFESGTLTVVEIKIPTELQNAINGIALEQSAFDYVEGTAPTLEVKQATIPAEVEIASIAVKEEEAILPGTYTAVITLTHTGAEAYPLKPIERTFVINKVAIDPTEIAALNSVAPTTTTFVYNGELQTLGLPTLPVWAKVSESTNASGKNVDDYSATFVVSVSNADFYQEFDAVTLNFDWTITPADLTITAKNKTITYGASPANDGFEVSGLLGEDTQSVLRGQAVYSYTYQQGQDAGAYEISISGFVADNYEITFEKGTLTVEKLSISLQNVSWGDQTTFSYSGDAIAPKLKNLPENVDVTYTYTLKNSTEEVSAVNVGEYTAKAVLPENSNYIFTDKPTLVFDYKIEALTIDFSNAEWTMANNAQVVYTGQGVKPTVVGYEQEQIKLIHIDYRYTQVGGLDTIDPINPGNYVAYATIIAADDGNIVLSGTTNGEITLSFEIIAHTLKDFAWNVATEIDETITPSKETELNYSVIITNAQVQSGYEVYLAGQDAQYVDVTYTLNNTAPQTQNITISSLQESQKVLATLTLKSQYAGAGYVLGVTEVWLYVTVSTKTFATLTLDGKAYNEEDLKNLTRFEYGSVLAFTMLEGYYVTNAKDQIVSSITFKETDSTFDAESQTFVIRIYAGEELQNLAKTYTFAEPYYLPAYSINGKAYTYEQTEDININFALQEDEIVINFEEAYLDKFAFEIDFVTITGSAGTVVIGDLPYTLKDAHLLASFSLMCEGETFSKSILWAHINQHYPFKAEEFTVASFEQTQTKSFMGQIAAQINNGIVAGAKFTGQDSTVYTNVKAYSDFALTTQVNMSDLASYDCKVTYFAVYDAEDALVAIVPKVLVHDFKTSTGFLTSPSLKAQTFSTNGAGVAKAVYSVTNADVSVLATLNGNSELALTQAQTDNVTLRFELTYNQKTYFFESTWTILRHYDAEQRIVATGQVANTTAAHKEEYTIGGNNLNLRTSKYFDASNITTFEADLENLVFTPLEGFTIASRTFVKIDNELFIELAFKDAQNQDAGKCLIKLYFNGSYDNNTAVTAYAMGLLDDSQTTLTITNDTITFTDPTNCFFAAAPSNTYAYVKVTDLEGNILADSTEYGYAMVQFRGVGTYNLVVCATDGTIKTYSIVVEGEYVPALEITVAEEKFVMETSLETGLIGDFYSDDYGNLVAYIGEDKLDLVDASGFLAITSFKTSLLVGYTVTDQDNNVLTEALLAEGFKLKVLYTEDDNQYPYVMLNVSVVENGQQETSLIILYLTEEQNMSVLNVVVDAEVSLQSTMSLDGTTFFGDFDVEDTADVLLFTAYLGADAQSSINQEDGTFTISSFEFIYEGRYFDMVADQEFTGKNNIALTVGSQDGVMFVSFAIVYTIEDLAYVAQVVLMLDDPLFKISYQGKHLVEFMIPAEAAPPTFTGDFEVNQTGTVFVGYLGKYMGEGEIPATITIDNAVCNYGTTFKDGFSNAPLTAPFNNVALTVGAYNEIPALCIVVDEEITIYLLLIGQYSVTFTFGQEVFDVNFEYGNADFGDLTLDTDTLKVTISEEVETFIMTFKEIFEDYSYAVISDPETIEACYAGSVTLQNVIDQGKIYLPADGQTAVTIPLTFVDGVATILLCVEGCTSTSPLGNLVAIEISVAPQN